MTRSPGDTVIWILVTTVTNLTGLPVVYLNWKKHRVFETVVMFYTFLTSFMYHLCESLGLKGDQGLWLSEGQWHRQDNVGSIMCFVLFFIYLTDFEDENTAKLCKFAFFFIIILLQEKGPWYLPFTIWPIAAAAFLFLLKRVFVNGSFPKCNSTYLKYCSVLHICGFICFFRGLDEHTDPYRMFHGGWHLFTGLAGYFDWQLLVIDKTKNGRRNM